MDEKKRDELKKRAASLGMAATLATAGLSGTAMKSGEKELTSNIGYIQEVDDDFNIEKNDNFSEVEKSDVVSSAEGRLDAEPTVTAYDIPTQASTTTAFADSVSPTIHTSTVNGTSAVNNVASKPASSGVVSNESKSGARIQKDIDYECYSLMQDANAYALGRFDSKFSSLSEALEANGIKLSTEQRARYDTIIADTYEVYKKGIASYEAGDMEGFRKICDEVLNSKKYLNLDDLVDIIASNINIQGGYIKNSGNYSIEDGKLIIDGYTIDGLLTSPNYVDNTDLMSLIKFYGNTSGNDRLVLDIMQVPIFVTKQVIDPTCYTMVNFNDTICAYNRSKVDERFNNILEAYKSKLGMDRFSFDIGHEVVAYDKDNNKHTFKYDDEYRAGLGYYLSMLNQYRKSEQSKVGFFDGDSMKYFLAQYENGIENIKTPGMIAVNGNDEYEYYSLMQDTIGFVLDGYSRNHGSLSETLEETYGVTLSPEQKARYDTIIEDTRNEYQRGIDAYKEGRVSDFRHICKEILADKKYLNLDDVVDIISINLNTQEKLINNSKNYSIADGKLVIDGKNVEKLIPDDYECVLDYIDLYNRSSDTAVLDIMRAPKAAVMEAINPTSFSIMTDGTYYGYSNNILKKKIGEMNQFFENSTGLNNLGYEKTDSGVVFYGFDEAGNKQIVSEDNEDIKALSRYLTTYKDELNEAANSRVGNFDGAMVRDYLQEYSTIGKNMSK